MKTIYKYPLVPNSEGKQVIELPSKSKILGVYLIAGQPVIYAIVNTDTSFSDYYRWYVYYTGWPINIDLEDVEYVGSLENSGLVSHYFVELFKSDI